MVVIHEFILFTIIIILIRDYNFCNYNLSSSAGLFSLSDVQSMVCEVNKMQDFDHPHVMSLIGVCLDAGPGIAIVMPYMANGSVIGYLKRERSSLELDDDCEIDQVCI